MDAVRRGFEGGKLPMRLFPVPPPHRPPAELAAPGLTVFLDQLLNARELCLPIDCYHSNSVCPSSTAHCPGLHSTDPQNMSLRQNMTSSLASRDAIAREPSIRTQMVCV